MHEAARQWVALHVPDRKVDVLEVGGRDINGTVRDLFDASSYLSIDLVAGNGVDEVADFTTWKGKKVDVVVCCEVAEHTPDWPALLENAARHLRKGGLLIFTAAGPSRAPHSAVDGDVLRDGEFYENVDPDDLRDVLMGHFERHVIDVAGDDVRAVGRV